MLDLADIKVNAETRLKKGPANAIIASLEYDEYAEFPESFNPPD
jgi:hypothetical protein